MYIVYRVIDIASGEVIPGAKVEFVTITRTATKAVKVIKPDTVLYEYHKPQNAA